MDLSTQTRALAANNPPEPSSAVYCGFFATTTIAARKSRVPSL
jgi:hypothetical protein